MQRPPTVVNGIGLHGVGAWILGVSLAAVWSICAGKWSLPSSAERITFSRRLDTRRRQHDDHDPPPTDYARHDDQARTQRRRGRQRQARQGRGQWKRQTRRRQQSLPGALERRQARGQERVRRRQRARRLPAPCDHDQAGEPGRGRAQQRLHGPAAVEQIHEHSQEAARPARAPAEVRSPHSSPN
jgi:hypothetical protein